MWRRLARSRISFRRQIILLGILAVVLLLAVIFASLAALQYTQSAVLKDDQHRLSEATNALVMEYQSETELDRLKNQPPLLENAETQASQEALSTLTRVVLHNLDGVQGGFYSSEENALIGYAFPTRPEERGSSNGKEITEEQRPAILRVAREAAFSAVSSDQVLTTGTDISLVSAMPLRDRGRVVGSAWTTKRLPAIPGTNRFRTYLIATALGIAALACVLLTLLVVRSLQKGVRKIEGGLKNLEASLSSQISIDTDPDEIRQIAQAINRLGTTLREKIESEKQIEDRLRHAERLAALGRLIAGVAHEVRNPLATIRLRVQMCQDSESPEVRESCAIALEEIQRLDGIVNRLLSFSRPIRLRSEPTDLDRLVKQRLDNFSELAKRHDIRFVTRFSASAGPVPVDQSRLAQVFDNVIQNAIEAMSIGGGTLCVNVTRDAAKSAAKGSEACVEFNDTGEGIRPEAVGDFRSIFHDEIIGHRLRFVDLP